MRIRSLMLKVVAGSLLVLGVSPMAAAQDQFEGLELGFVASRFTLSAELPPTWASGQLVPDVDLVGFGAGLHVGGGFQFGNLFVGGGIDIQRTNVSGTRTVDYCQLCYDWSYIDNQTVTMPYFGTARVRVGFTPTPNVLVYGTAGLAVGLFEVLHGYVSEGYVSEGKEGFGYFYHHEYSVLERFAAVGTVFGAGVSIAIGEAFSLNLEVLSTTLHGPSLLESPNPAPHESREVRGTVINIGFAAQF